MATASAKATAVAIPLCLPSHAPFLVTAAPVSAPACFTALHTLSHPPAAFYWLACSTRSDTPSRPRTSGFFWAASLMLAKASRERKKKKNVTHTFLNRQAFRTLSSLDHYSTAVLRLESREKAERAAHKKPAHLSPFPRDKKRVCRFRRR